MKKCPSGGGVGGGGWAFARTERQTQCLVSMFLKLGDCKEPFNLNSVDNVLVRLGAEDTTLHHFYCPLYLS